MWYCIWFIGMCATLYVTIKLLARMEAQSAFDETSE